MRNLALLVLLFIVSGCIPASDSVKYVKPDRLAAYPPENFYNIYAKPVIAASDPGQILIADMVPGFTARNEIEICFDPQVRSGNIEKLSMSNDWEVVTPQRSVFDRGFIKRVKSYKWRRDFYDKETSTEVLDKLCKQYGAEDDLLKADENLLSCFENDEFGYKHPWLAKNPTPTCRTFGEKLKQGFKEEDND